MFQETLGFLSFYGRNMDAWIDCLTSVDSPADGLTAVTVETGQLLVLRVDNPFEFRSRCPEQYDALVECSALVTSAAPGSGEAPVACPSALWPLRRESPLPQQPASQRPVLGRKMPGGGMQVRAKRLGPIGRVAALADLAQGLTVMIETLPANNWPVRHTARLAARARRSNVSGVRETAATAMIDDNWKTVRPCAAASSFNSSHCRRMRCAEGKLRGGIRATLSRNADHSLRSPATSSGGTLTTSAAQPAVRSSPSRI